MRVRVDGERCMGNAVCIRIAPAAFRIDDEGYAQPLHGLVDDSAVITVTEAARLCPTNAIELDDT